MPTFQGYDPYSAEADEIERKRKYADLLRQQSMRPIQPARAGNMVAPIHWTQGAAQLLQGASAGAADRQASEERRALSERRTSDRQQSLSEALRLGSGQGLAREDAAGNLEEYVPAGKPDLVGAYSRLAMSRDPMLSQMGLQGQFAQMQPRVIGEGGVLLGPDNKPLFENKKDFKPDKPGVTWGEPYQMGGAWVQKSSDGQIRQAVAREPRTTIVNPAAVTVTEVMRDGKLVKIDARTGKVIGDAPQGGQGKPMTATAQRELIQTEEELQGGQQALSFIQQAKDVNDKAMGFTGAGMVASAGSLLPQAMRPETVDATMELTNIIQNTALPQLKAIFGGMPTEGERKILLEMQGSANQPPAVRKNIFERAEKAVQARLKFSQEKSKRLREGSYFSGEGLPSIKLDSVGSSSDPLGIR